VGADADVVALPAEVTFAGAPDVLDEGERAIAAGARSVDLSACVRFDSSLIGVLLELARKARQAGRPCRFDAASPNVRKLARLYGVDELLFGAPA
jgi:ABC-type transporter Mla MlaB component